MIAPPRNFDPDAAHVSAGSKELQRVTVSILSLDAPGTARNLKEARTNLRDLPRGELQSVGCHSGSGVGKESSGFAVDGGCTRTPEYCFVSINGFEVSIR